MYHALVPQRRVERPIVVLHSDHDPAWHGVSRLAVGGAEAARRTAPGRGGHARTIVAASTIGRVGARGVGAPALTLAEVGRVGVPSYPVVNVDGSAVIRVADRAGSTHGDICHPAIATLLLLAGGLLQGGPDGIPPRLDRSPEREAHATGTPGDAGASARRRAPKASRVRPAAAASMWRPGVTTSPATSAASAAGPMPSRCRSRTSARVPGKERTTDATRTWPRRLWSGGVTMTTLNLHPEALADLRRSGLSDATIVEAGLHTPAPGDLPRLLGPRLVNKVAHILVVPYRGADPFYRAKLFPPVPDGAGHTIRYYQPAGTAPRVYLPASVDAVLADPSIGLS